MSSDDDEPESSVDLSLLSEGSDDDGGSDDGGSGGGGAGAPPASRQRPAAGGPQQQQAAPGAQQGEQNAQQQEQEKQQQQEPRQPAAQAGKAGKPLKARRKVLSADKLARQRAREGARGIVYVSRIPPHMKPAKLRQLLSAHGAVGRVYCTPEDKALRRKRKAHGGDTGKNFTEGWVEFEDKRVAKAVAAGLNNTPIGGKHRSAYRFDLWCLKYLPKFKWDHLTEEVTYERAVREQRLAAELSAAKRERDFYLSRVDAAKAGAAIEARRAAKGGSGGGGGAGAAAEGRLAGGDEEGAGGRGPERAARHYGQRKAKPDPVTAPDAPRIGDDVLGMVVAKRRRAG